MKMKDELFAIFVPRERRMPTRKLIHGSADMWIDPKYELFPVGWRRSPRTPNFPFQERERDECIPCLPPCESFLSLLAPI